VKLLLCDVDGVMTDGSIFITADGEFKQFGIQDGLGLVILRKHGVKVGWISARPSIITTKRAEELHIDFLSQQKGSKVAAAEQILSEGWIELG
jgi:3-deoxy-D-manno-octulosonate 8-phosphate phosphatase (KDO 8-P phosphatase)